MGEHASVSTQDRLAGALCLVARDIPLERVGVKEVVARAGLSRATFYRHFPSVYELRDYLESSLVNHVVDRAVPALKSGAPAGDDAFFRAFLNLVVDHRDEMAFLLNDWNRSHLIACVVETMAARGVLPGGPAPTARQRLVMEIYYAGLFSALARWVRADVADAGPGASLGAGELLDVVRDLFSFWYWPEMQR